MKLSINACNFYFIYYNSQKKKKNYKLCYLQAFDCTAFVACQHKVIIMATEILKCREKREVNY